MTTYGSLRRGLSDNGDLDLGFLDGGNSWGRHYGRYVDCVEKKTRQKT